MHQKELQVVRFSMIVLFSALMVVYLILYQIKWDDIAHELSVINDQSIENLLYNDKESELNNKKPELNNKDSIWFNIDSFDEENSLLEDTNKSLETWDNNIKETNSLFDDSDISTNDNKINILSGTSLRYWRVESVEKLWISYQYALKDQKDIYYVSLEPNRYKFEEIIKTLWWTTYTIRTEKDILENKLFWDAITFINLPEYKEKKVVMLIEIKKTLWLIQIDYNIYHNIKWYIKTLFIK